MSQVVLNNDTAYLCGQVAKDSSKDITHQTLTTLEKVDELLESVHSNRKKLLSATVYIKTMKDFDAMNAVWDKWIPNGYSPARTCVQACLAREELLVEITVIAQV
jgi:enamine deaminase RidA (YjgF/YER057c/UK114 family)